MGTVKKEESLRIIYSRLDELYTRKQLEVIANTLAHNYDVRPLMSQKFDADQMWEINKGLASGVDVSLYANTDLSAKDMQEYRKRLEESRCFCDEKQKVGTPPVLREPIKLTLKDVIKFNFSYVWLKMFG